MKVFPKILGAILLLGCLAYISFVFGKYVLSSSLLKSIPKSERIINANNPAPNSAPAIDQSGNSPRIEMRVLPTAQNSGSGSSGAANSSDSEDSADSGDASDAGDKKEETKKAKTFDEAEVSPSRRRRKRRTEDSKKSDTATSNLKTNNSEKAPGKKAAPSSSAPVRRLNQTGTSEDSSPVPKPEKSTSAPEKDDSASISPVPQPE